ncbi:hypothetical protein T10_7865 [Trichinella papuae]|uniref:Uncharacterized protein n=1 Tax=Trichinella papuae TaxID=268474 RepID=A0A0V1MVT6_9BILA|nr:hypothetical protein T10_7865 [Trichinella papuae]
MKPEMKASTKNDILLIKITFRSVNALKNKRNRCVEDSMKLLLEFDFTVADNVLLTNEMYHCKSVKASSVPYYYNGCNVITVNYHSNSLRNLERNQFPYVSILISFAHKYAAP